MIGFDLDHCRVVSESLTAQRDVDEQTFASLAVLGERLERLKEVNNVFSGVAFSPDVEKLKNRAETVSTP